MKKEKVGNEAYEQSRIRPRSHMT